MQVNSISLLKNERGVIYPFVFGLCFLVITVTMFSALQYKSNVTYTENLEAAYMYQSLFETGHRELIELIKTNKLDKLASSYTFYSPLGTASATCAFVQETKYACTWQMEINDGKTKLVSQSYDLTLLQ
ncbi:hypothetical protein MUN89_11080 [Halobacillus salinarum]|uniref:ComG operon protein 7 n=1 Tax=Halobacillus salinarum TaxID=2932257 RepID=A0ABY4EDK7_9BACI|nr:hypothetical protein [Halobacillus salinarum]UOQ42531.1 hypothetical protein MUN89_11080 [Halobacillus salinarum]